MSQTCGRNQVIIAQWLAWQLATVEVPGSNPDKGDNLLISDLKGNLNNSHMNTIKAGTNALGEQYKIL